MPGSTEAIRQFVDAVNSGKETFAPDGIWECYQNLPISDEAKEQIADAKRMRESLIPAAAKYGGAFKLRNGDAGLYKITELRVRQRPEVVISHGLELIMVQIGGKFRPPFPVPQADLRAMFCIHNDPDYLETMQVEPDSRRCGLAELAVLIVGSGRPKTWWCAGTDDGMAFSQAMVRKGLAKSIGFKSPRGILKHECFEYIKPADQYNVNGLIWSKPISAMAFAA